MPCHGTMIGAISAFYMCIADFKDGKKCWSIQGYTLVTWWKRASSQVNCPEYARILLQTLFFFTQGWSIMVNLIWYSNWDSFGNLLWMNWLKQGNRSLKNPFHPWRWKSPKESVDSVVRGAARAQKWPSSKAIFIFKFLPNYHHWGLI